MVADKVCRACRLRRQLRAPIGAGYQKPNSADGGGHLKSIFSYPFRINSAGRTEDELENVKMWHRKLPVDEDIGEFEGNDCFYRKSADHRVNREDLHRAIRSGSVRNHRIRLESF